MNNNVSSTTAGATTNGVPPPTSVKPVPYQKPVPPPTLPKTYTPSAVSAYRLASLERLTAHRQRALEQQLNSSLSATNGVSESPVIIYPLFRLAFCWFMGICWREAQEMNIIFEKNEWGAIAVCQHVLIVEYLGTYNGPYIVYIIFYFWPLHVNNHVISNECTTH